MSGNSFVGGLGRSIVQPFHDLAHLFKPDTPAPPQAPPPPPEPGGVMQGELQNELSDEERMRASSTLLTGGQGVAAVAPTASQMLMGR